MARDLYTKERVRNSKKLSKLYIYTLYSNGWKLSRWSTTSIVLTINVVIHAAHLGYSWSWSMNECSMSAAQSHRGPAALQCRCSCCTRAWSLRIQTSLTSLLCSSFSLRWSWWCYNHASATHRSKTPEILFNFSHIYSIYRLARLGYEPQAFCKKKKNQKYSPTKECGLLGQRLFGNKLN